MNIPWLSKKPPNRTSAFALQRYQQELEVSAYATSWSKPDSTHLYQQQVTVVIPACHHQVVGLQAFAAQEEVAEVLVLSNGAGPLWADNARVLRVAWQGHSRTRLQALSMVQTPYVFFSVDDAFPLPYMLAYLVEALERENWEAICPRQIAWPDAHAVTHDRLAKWTPDRAQTYALLQCDHVGTLYRTETVRRSPFPDVPIAEDAWWSQGRRVGCHPAALIVHSHVRSPRALYTREKAIHHQLQLMGSAISKPSRMAVCRSACQAILDFGVEEGINHFAEGLGQRHGHKMCFTQPKP